MARSSRRFKGIIVISPTGQSFMVVQHFAKWYLMGASVDHAMIHPLVGSTNKRSLMRYIKNDLGFIEA
jgi:hypothetical protein